MFHMNAQLVSHSIGTHMQHGSCETIREPRVIGHHGSCETIREPRSREYTQHGSCDTISEPRVRGQFWLVNNDVLQPRDKRTVDKARVGVYGGGVGTAGAFFGRQYHEFVHSAFAPIPDTGCGRVWVSGRQRGRGTARLSTPTSTTCGSSIAGVGDTAQPPRCAMTPPTSETAAGRATKTKVARPSRPPLLPPCRVCEAKASGYHYGVNTCEACKVFFRRSICKKEPYVCVGNGDCVIRSGKQRSTCSHCRQKKCIIVGMSKFAIKTGRYTHELRTKNIVEAKRLQTAADNLEVPAVEPRYQPDPAACIIPPPHVVVPELEELLTAVMKGQGSLHEFLDDYYDDEMIAQRQLDVYNRYTSQKIKRVKRATEAKKTSHSDIFLEKLESVCSSVQSDMDGVCKCSSVTHLHAKHALQEASGTMGVTASMSVCTSGMEGSRTLPPVSHVAVWPQHVGSHSYTNTSTNSSPMYSPAGYEATADSLPDVLGSSVHNHIEATSRVDERTTRSREIQDKLAWVSTTFQNLIVSSLPKNRQQAIVENKHLTAETETTGKETPAADKPPADDIDESIELTSELAISENTKIHVINQVISDMERGVHGLVLFSKSVPGFRDLRLDDQASLLKASRFDIWYIGHIRCFNSRLQVGACEWRFHGDELEHVWGRALVDMLWTLTNLGQKLDLTKEETACLRGISVTFPDRCHPPLNERAKVEAIHDQMNRCFKYVASRKSRRHFNRWFTRVINFLVYLREFGIEFEKHSNHLNLEWLVVQKNPLLLEVFFS